MANFEQDTNLTETDITSDSLFPEPTGPYSVGTTSYNFVDSEREEIYTEDENDNREITARVWYPSHDVADGPSEPYLNPELSSAVANELGIPAEDLLNVTQFLTTNSTTDAPISEAQSEYPVLFFSHGFGDLPEFNTLKAEELASQGYVVVGINHTYDSTASVLSDGEIVTQSSVFEVEDQSELLELFGESVDIRSEDAQFVLDELTQIDAGEDPNNLLSGHLDLDTVGIYGYSLGGATAAKVLAEDHRFQAGINLDGGLFGDVANISLDQPFMILNNEAFGQGTSSSPEVNQFNQLQQSFVENLQNDGYEVTILGTEHSSFSDLPLFLPLLLNSGIELGDLGELVNAENDSGFEPIDPQLASQIINDYTLAFFDRYLNNEPSSLLTEDMSSIYPEVIFQAYPGADSNTQVTILKSESTNTDASDTGILGTGDILIGGEDSNLFFGGFQGGSTFSGNDGADLFWVVSAEIPESATVISDFTSGEDVIGITGLGINFGDLDISQQQDNALIAFNGSDFAIVQGIDSSSLVADDFIFG